MGLGREPSFRVFVHYSCGVFNSRLPASFRGRCTPSVRKLGRRPRACLIALSRMPSMVVICLSLNTPRCVAWYLDFSNSFVAIDFRGRLSLRFARALANFLTS